MSAVLAQSDEMELALSKRNKMDERLIVHFYRKPVLDEAETAKEQRPIYRDAPYVKITTPGDVINVIDRPVWDDPRQENSDTSRFAEKWGRFQAGIAEEKHTSGTPVDKLPAITAGQVEELKHFHVRTIEQLANLDDVHAQRFMGIQQLKQRAQAWLQAAAGNAPLERMRSELEKRDAALEDEKRKREELEAQVAELMRAHRAPKGSVSALQDQAAELAALEAKAELAHEGKGRSKSK